MKWLTILLLLITAAATFVPCCQADDCCGDEPVSSSTTDQQEGVCSPFFSCTTCQAFVELAKPIQLNPLQALKEKHPAGSTGISLPGWSLSFWQPPRLV